MNNGGEERLWRASRRMMMEKTDDAMAARVMRPQYKQAVGCSGKVRLSFEY
jgi:hypothetical protein